MNNQKNINSNKSFGYVFSVFFLIVFAYLYIQTNKFFFVFLLLSILLFILGFFNSKILSPLNKIWIKFGILLGRIISPIIMGFIFFCVVTPIGVMLKLFKKDVLRLKLKNYSSFWVNKDNKSKMKDQF
tara:strand:- start:2512 stop:2895 length:384 start_codon:yes stop_codon:yes gene_type:complete